jgi:hypothetical protein
VEKMLTVFAYFMIDMRKSLRRDVTGETSKPTGKKI